MLFLQSISNLMETRREKGYSTALRKNRRAHTHIQGNELADASAKLVVTDFDTLHEEQMARVDIGAVARGTPSGSCTLPTTPRPHQPYPRGRDKLPFVHLGGQSWKPAAFKCTPSRAHHSS